MPLTSDVELAIRAAQVESVESATLHARYPSAQDGSLSPAEGFFDSASDAQAVLTARQAIFGVETRRYTVTGISELLWPPDVPAIPRLALTDLPQELVSTPFITSSVLATRVELDLETGRTSYEVFG